MQHLWSVKILGANIAKMKKCLQTCRQFKKDLQCQEEMKRNKKRMTSNLKRPPRHDAPNSALGFTSPQITSIASDHTPHLIIIVTKRWEKNLSFFPLVRLEEKQSM